MGSSIAAAGCSGEPLITTELPEDAPAALGDGSRPSGSTNDRAGGSAPPASGSSEPVPSNEAGPVPAQLSGGGAEVLPGAEGEAGPMPVAIPEVPPSDYCALVSAWDPDWSQFEDEVLLLVNQRRATPTDCGEEGEFDATGPVVTDPILRCSARLHSLDMFERDFFNHTNPDGKDPFARMTLAGFKGRSAGENIAVGQTSPQQVMQSWMDSDGHCANVMRPSYTLLGVGYHAGAGTRGLGSNFWTQNFGAPRNRR